jgi:hypothetical protein
MLVVVTARGEVGNGTVEDDLVVVVMAVCDFVGVKTSSIKQADVKVNIITRINRPKNLNFSMKSSLLGL